jgi:hypothetical protein
LESVRSQCCAGVHQPTGDATGETSEHCQCHRSLSQEDQMNQRARLVHEVLERLLWPHCGRGASAIDFKVNNVGRASCVCPLLLLSWASDRAQERAQRRSAALASDSLSSHRQSHRKHINQPRPATPSPYFLPHWETDRVRGRGLPRPQSSH